MSLHEYHFFILLSAVELKKCSFYYDSNKISISFQSTSESVIKKATLLSDMHLKNLRQKLLLKQRTDEAVKRLQVTIFP